MNQPDIQITQPPAKNAYARWSLRLGILGITGLLALTGVPAVVCGHLALLQTSQDAEAQRIRRKAWIGLITGYLSIALTFWLYPYLLALLDRLLDLWELHRILS